MSLSYLNLLQSVFVLIHEKLESTDMQAMLYGDNFKLKSKIAIRAEQPF